MNRASEDPEDRSTLRNRMVAFEREFGDESGERWSPHQILMMPGNHDGLTPRESQEVFAADARGSRQLTGAYAVYVARGVDGELLYVGITNGHMRRWREHLGRKPWASEVRSMEVQAEGLTEREAREMERDLIREDRPLYNVVHNRPGRPSARRRRRRGTYSRYRYR
jgi:hypothetical protein